MTTSVSLPAADPAALVPVHNLPADQNAALCYLASLAPGSRRTLRGALDTVAQILSSGACDALTLPWHALRFQHTAAVRAVVAARSSPATANKVLAALRGTLKAAWRLGLMTAEDYQRAADLAPVRGSSLPRGRALSAGELRALFAACAADPTAAGRRDAAMLALLYGCGLRRAEVAGLDVADYDKTGGALTVRGKGNKQRLAFLAPGAAAALDAWLTVRGNQAGRLFVAIDQTGTLATSLTAQGVYDVCRKRGAAAGVAPFAPHDLRRSFVGDLLDAGADVVTVQALAGHSNVATTARYDRRPDQARRRAAGLLLVPYQAPNRTRKRQTGA